MYIQDYPSRKAFSICNAVDSYDQDEIFQKAKKNLIRIRFARHSSSSWPDNIHSLFSCEVN